MKVTIKDRIVAHRSAPDVYDPPSFEQMANRIEELEAKLAKAVEEAEKYQYAFAAQSRKLQAVLHIEGVRTTLAELKGQDDE